MRRSTQGVLLLLAGVVALRLVWTGSYLDYVKDRMIGPLVATGLVLFGLGLATVVIGARSEGRGASPEAAGSDDPGDEHEGEHEAEHGGEHGDGHGHGDAGPKVAWLLVLPLVAILLVAPRALGADAASRQNAEVPTTSGSRLPPLLEPVDGHVPMEISAFLVRAHYDDEASLIDLPVRLTGFVVHDEAEAPGGFLLSRFAIACCAADGQLVQVAVVDQGVPPQDTWVEVEGTLRPDPRLGETLEQGGLPLVFLDATSVREVEAPRNPYE